MFCGFHTLTSESEFDMILEIPYTFSLDIRITDRRNHGWWNGWIAAYYQKDELCSPLVQERRLDSYVLN